MKFICGQCSTKYAIDDARVRGKVLKVRCKACQNLITVRDPSLGAPADEAAGVPTESNEAHARGEAPGPIPPREPELHQPGALAQDEAQDGEEHTQVSSLPVALADAMRGRGPAPGVTAVARTEWFVSFDGEQEGPHTLERARQRIRVEAPLGREVYCWREGFEAWTAADKVPELAVALVPAPVASATVRSAGAPAAAVSAQRTMVEPPSELLLALSGRTGDLPSHEPLAPASAPADPPRDLSPAAAASRLPAAPKLDFDDSTVAASPRPSLLARSRQEEPRPSLAATGEESTSLAPSPQPLVASLFDTAAAPAEVTSLEIPPPIDLSTDPYPRVSDTPAEAAPLDRIEDGASASAGATASDAVEAVGGGGAEGPAPTEHLVPEEQAPVAAPPAVAAAAPPYDAAQDVAGAPADPVAASALEPPVVDKVSAIENMPEDAALPGSAPAIAPARSAPAPRTPQTRKGGASASGPAALDEVGLAGAPHPALLEADPPPRRGLVYALVACVAVILLLGGVLVWQAFGRAPAMAAQGALAPSQPRVVQPPPIDDRPVGFVDTAPTAPVAPPPVTPPPEAEPRTPRKAGGHSASPARPAALTEDQKRLAAMYRDVDKPAQLEALPKLTREDKPKEAVSNSDIMSVVNRGKKSVQMCFERSLKRDGVLKNLRVDVELKIGLSGSVTSVGLGDSRIGSTELGTCLKQTIKRWHFPAQDSEYQTAFPLLLQAQ